MKRHVLAALVVLTLCASQASAQNAVKNPSFEDPTVDGAASSLGAWYRFQSGTGSSTESTVDPLTGARHIALEVAGANQFAGVFQRLESLVNPGQPRSISPGQTVTLSGFHKLVSGAVAPTSEIKLEWTGAAQNRLDVFTVSGPYAPFAHVGVAPAGTTGLTVTYAISSFGAGQGDALVHLDDVLVTVVPVPEPATAGLIGAGVLGLVGFVRRRK
jgi:hypothetical protein